MNADIQMIDRGDGVRLACRHRAGRAPTLVYLPGYAFDMEGVKATAVDGWAKTRGIACLRLDYSGTGKSEGEFLEGTITRWTADVVAAVDALAPGPVVVVGSSLGGWIALAFALARPEQTRALVLLAPAPDFTQWDLVEKLKPKERASLAKNGWFERADPGDTAPTRYSRALIDDGARHRILGGPVAYSGPVRIVHGQEDAQVPWNHSLFLAGGLASADVQLTLVKDGEHRLSRASDLALLNKTLEALPF